MEPFLLERYFAEHEFSTQYLLGSSDCESMTVRELLALEPGAQAALLDCWLGYTDSRGAGPLRTEIAQLYDHITPEHVLVHAGAEEAIYTFVRAVLRPGDRVVVQHPCYQSLTAVAQAHGCEIVLWEPVEEDPWCWSVGDLARLSPRGTRAILVNSPQNPTGHQFSADDFSQVVGHAEDIGAVLFSDEVYRFSELDGPPLAAACDLSRGAVSLGVLSKSFGLPGLRIGWVATRDNTVLDAMAHYKDYLTICNSAPSEVLSAVALRHRDTVLAQTRELLRRHRDVLADWLDAYGGLFCKNLPAAGPIAFVGLRGGKSSEDLCAKALAGGVMLVPSTAFAYGDRHVRIGFGRRNFAEALARLDAVLA